MIFVFSSCFVLVFYFYSFCFVLLFAIGSQSSPLWPELAVLLLQPPECWSYRCISPGLLFVIFFLLPTLLPPGLVPSCFSSPSGVSPTSVRTRPTLQPELRCCLAHGSGAALPSIFPAGAAWRCFQAGFKPCASCPARLQPPLSPSPVSMTASRRHTFCGGQAH